MACCHQNRHPSPPPPPPLDPLLLQSIASLLLHHYPTPPPAAFHGSARSPSAHHSCSCSSDHSDHHYHKDIPPPHHLSDPSIGPILSSLLQRMDLLESSLQKLSSPPSPDNAVSLRDLAARRIQTGFRAFLVHRSRAFRRLKELNSLNSTLDNKSTDSSSVSSPETIEDGDETALDNKKLLLRAFAEFLEQVEGNGISSKTVKDILPVSNDEKSQVSCANKETQVVSHGNCNLKESVRMRFSEIFQAKLLDEDASKQCRVAGDQSGSFRGAEERKRLQSNADKRVRFLQDEKNATTVVSGDANKVGDAVEKEQDDVEVDNDGKKNLAELVDGSAEEDENEGSEDEYENEDCEEEEDEYETEMEGEDESRDCSGAENAIGNSTQPIIRLSDDAKKIKQKAENQQDELEVESDGSQSVEGNEDEYDTETENENEGSEDEYDTETENVNNGSEDEYETENEGSECESETEYEEEEEEGSEVEDEVENASVSNIPQDNKNNGNGVRCCEIMNMQQMREHQAMNLQQMREHSLEMKRDPRNVVCHICFKRGHMKRKCWYNPIRLCHKCHMIGHTQQVCDIVRKQQLSQSQTSNS